MKNSKGTNSNNPAIEEDILIHKNKFECLNDEVVHTVVLNLTENKKLNDNEINLLKKGAKFTPVPKRNNYELQKDVNQFCRTLRLKEFFHDKEDSDESIVKNKSTFTPQKDRNDMLESYIDVLSNSVNNSANRSKKKKNNLVKNEMTALEELKNNPSLVIKQADKGGAFVIMDKDYYIDKMSEQLKDSKTYRLLEENEDKRIMTKIKTFVKQHKDILTEKETDYLTKFESKTSNFYGLPKVHKSSQITETVLKMKTDYIECNRPEDLKMRPIVGGPNCPTHRLSNFIDILLKPFLKHVQSYIRDGVDFLNHLPETIDETSLLVTFDVKSLYTNIDHSAGLEAISFWLNEHPQDLHPRITKSFVLEAIKIILSNNVFQFNGDYYIQLRGTAMGTKMAPTYANLFLGYLETRMYVSVGSHLSPQTSVYIKKNWYRYLDDCFIIWKSEFGPIEHFTKILQNMHPDIKFTVEKHKEEINFLDVKVIKRDQKIITDVHYKITDTHQYLHFDSCHPRHTKRTIPFNLARRICTIVSEKELKKKRLKELESMLVDRKYPPQLIKSGIEKANKLDITELRKKKEDNHTYDMIPFVHTYNPNNSNLYDVVRTTFPILKTDEIMKEVLANSKLIASRRQAPNLKRILSPSSLVKDPGIVKNCSDKRCRTCPYMPPVNSIKFKSTNKTFVLKSTFSCVSKNLIYCITCNGCSKQYIGETGDTLRNRMTVHRQHIRDTKYQTLYVSKHIATCAKGISPEFSITPFYKMQSEEEFGRKNKEKYFISVFKPELNSRS